MNMIFRGPESKHAHRSRPLREVYVLVPGVPQLLDWSNHMISFGTEGPPRVHPKPRQKCAHHRSHHRWMPTLQGHDGWWIRAKHYLRQHYAKDGASDYRVAPITKSFPWHSPWKEGRAPRLDHLGGHLWNRGKLLGRATLFGGSTIQGRLPYIAWPTCIRQIHGNTLLCVYEAQDAGTKWNHHHLQRPKEHT